MLKMHKWHKCKLIQEFRCHYMVPIGLMLNVKTIKLCTNEGFEDSSDKILTMNKFYDMLTINRFWQIQSEYTVVSLTKIWNLANYRDILRVYKIGMRAYAEAYDSISKLDLKKHLFGWKIQSFKRKKLLQKQPRITGPEV